jgi:hypothetical protein
VAADDRPKTAENVATIKPQVEDDTTPGGYYRLLRDIAQWMPKNSILSGESLPPRRRSTRAAMPAPLVFPDERSSSTGCRWTARSSSGAYAAVPRCLHLER